MDEEEHEHEFSPWLIRPYFPLALMRYCMLFGCPYQEIEEIDK